MTLIWPLLKLSQDWWIGLKLDKLRFNHKQFFVDIYKLRYKERLFILNVCINRLLHIIIDENLFSIGEIIKEILLESFEIHESWW